MLRVRKNSIRKAFVKIINKLPIIVSKSNLFSSRTEKNKHTMIYFYYRAHIQGKVYPKYHTTIWTTARYTNV